MGMRGKSDFYIKRFYIIFPFVDEKYVMYGKDSISF
jgi:hypothetical protein